MKQIRYYYEYEPPYGCLSNYARIGFELDGVWWPSSEHCGICQYG
jgi:N-glycosidase YbiA